MKRNYKNIDYITRIADTLFQWDLNLTAFQLKAFTLIAKEEGLSVSDLQARTGYTKPTAARIFRTLSERESPTRLGHNLIELNLDPTDYRVRRAALNERGRKLAIELQLLEE